MMLRSPLAAGRMMAAARRAFHSQAQSRFRSRLNHTIAGEQQMTLTPLSAAARNSLPRLPQELEPLLRQHYARDVETVKRGPMDAYEVKRAKIFKQLEEIEVKTHREIVEDVEKVKRMESEDRDFLNRLLTSCGVPKGEFRDKLIFGCNLAALFLASSAVGTWNAERDVRNKSARNASNQYSYV